MIKRLDVLQITDVMYACLGEVIGVYDTAQTAESMELVAKEVSALGGAVAEVRGFGEVFAPAHLAAFPASDTAHLYGHGVYAEVVLAAINVPCDAAAYLLQQIAHRLAAVIKLATGDKVGNRGAALFQPGLKQPVLAVYLFGFRCHAQGYNLQVREAGNWTGATDISFFCYQIIGELLAYLQKFNELCVQVAHNKII